VAYGRLGSSDGFDCVWAPSVSLVGPPDALVLLGALGPVTSRIELGSYVVPTFPRHPVVLAQQALTVQQSSSNRLALGIGLSHKPVIETGFGLSFSHPIRHLREYLTVLTPLLAGRAVQMSGQHYRVQQEPSLPPDVKPPPVLVAALAPQMLRLAGELADGTALGAHHGPSLTRSRPVTAPPIG
jgi:5,10-methylenetetrahydromethanopterin reductase